MRLVEAVLGKLLDLFEDGLRDLRLDVAVGLRSLDELIPVPLHQLDLLLAHRLSQAVCVVHREARKVVGDLHHLFLIEDHPVGHVEDRLQGRVEVFDLFPAMFAVAVEGMHTRTEWAGSIQRKNCDQILEAVGNQVSKQLSHAVALELEYAVGLTLAEQLVGGLVIERNGLDIDRFTLLGDQAASSIDDGEIAQSKEVHLEQTQLLQRLHRILGHDVIAVFGERDQVGQGAVGDDHPGGMGRAVTIEPLQSHPDIEQLLKARILCRGSELWFLFQSFFQFDAKSVRNLLGQLIDIAERDTEGSPDIANHRLGRHRPEGDDLTHSIFAVLLLHVLDHLFTAIHAEVDVDVRHRDPVRVEESFKDEVVFERAEIGDREAVGNDRADRRSSTGADRNPLRSGVPTKIPGDEEIGNKSHLDDHRDLVGEALARFLGRFGVEF